MRARRRVHSIRQVTAWLIVAAGLALYGTLVLGLGMARISPSLPLPWWAALALPPLLYAFVVRLSFLRISIVRWITATLCLWWVHVVLGALTAVAVSYLGPLSVDFGPAEAFPPPAGPEILWVPLLLIPFRDVLRGRSPAPPRGRTAGRHVDGVRRDGAPAPLPAARPTSPAMARPGMPTQPRMPGLPSSTDRPGPRGFRQTGSVPYPSPVSGGPSEGHVVAKAKETIGGAAPPGDAAGSAPPRIFETEHGGPAVLVRVSFDRVAGQFPPGAFEGAVDRIGAGLREPGHLLIPQRLVLAQLAEGFVRAGWEVVAEQFPRQMLSMTDEEITRRLTDGQLVLPLDELVAQLPHDLFALSGRAVDVQGIESVPAPFQPVMGLAGEGGRTGVHGCEAPPMTPAEAVTESPVPKAEWSFGDQLSAEAPPPETRVLEDVELDPVLTGAPEGSVQSAIRPQRRPSRRGSAEDFVAWPRAAGEGAVACLAAHETSLEPVKAAPELDLIAMTQRITTTLAPFRPLDIGVESVEGGTLCTVSRAGSGSALAAGRLLLPLLGEGRAPWPVNQLTMRGADVVLILTPLGLVEGGRAVLLSAVPPGGTVASVERLSLRAAASGAGDSAEPPQGDPDQPDEWQEPDLLDSEVSTRVHQIAASLGALGSVTASVLRDAEAERDLYLFLPEGSNVRMTGQFAGELDQAVRKLAESGHTFHAAVLRCGRRRLIIRLEPAAARRAAIVIAGGETDRAGLAYRQVEAAALVLRAG